MDEPVANPEPVQIVQPKSGFRWYVVAVGVVVACVLMGVGFWAGKRVNTSKEVEVIAAPISTVVPADPTANWKTYSVSKFSFKYPLDWRVGQPVNSPNTFLLQPSEIFNSESQKNRISVSVSDSCLNTQCLTVFDLDGYINNSGLEVVGQSKIDGLDANKVIFSNRDIGYIVIKDKTVISVSTDKYYNELDQVMSTVKFMGD